MSGKIYDSNDICHRLCVAVGYGDGPIGLVNPDGPRAAGEIQRLRSENDSLRERLAELRAAADQADTEYRAEIERLKTNGSWISIRDQLPPLDERVLYVHAIDGVVGHEANAGRWNGRRTRAGADGLCACVMDYGDENGDWEPCTHWMYLPDPPSDRATSTTSGDKP